MIFICLFLSFLNLNKVYSELIINEIISSNQGFYLEPDGENSDWIEIYNNSLEPINLNNYSLSFDENVINKWNSPRTNIIINPNEYLIVFCTEKNKKHHKSD